MALFWGGIALENLIYALNASVPIFLMMLLGYIFRRIGLVDEIFAKKLDRFTNYAAIPVMLFNQIRKIDVYSGFNWKYLIFSAGFTALSALTCWAAARKFIKAPADVAPFAQACYRSSSAILGLSFILNTYGTVGMASLMVLGSVPVSNALVVVMFTVQNAPETDRRTLAKRVLKGIVTNQFIIGILLGLLCSLLRLNTFQAIPEKVFTNLGSLGTPLALLSIGISFKGREALASVKLSAISTFVRLVVVPVIMLPAAILCGFRQELLMGILIMAGSPCSPAGYVLTKNMGGNAALASSTIMLTTIFSALTLTFWIFVLKSLALL